MFRDTYESYLQKQASWSGIARKLAGLVQGFRSRNQMRKLVMGATKGGYTTRYLNKNGLSTLPNISHLGTNARTVELSQLEALRKATNYPESTALKMLTPGYKAGLNAPTLQNVGAAYLGPEQRAQVKALLGKSNRSAAANQWLHDLQDWNVGNQAMFNSNPPRIPKSVLDEITLKNIL